VSLRVKDVAPHGHSVDRATVRQKKTCHTVRLKMTEQTREAVDSYSRAANEERVSSSSPARRGRDRPMTIRQ
jgi:hypothetical protein